MISLLPDHQNFNSHNPVRCDYKIYTMFKHGLYKTCGHSKALELLKNGWGDQTKYNPNEEVLHYEIQEQQRLRTWDAWEANQNDHSSERQHEEVGSRSESRSEREESRHEQHQPDLCNDGGKEHLLQTVRSGQKCGEVIRKRGRPKRVI